HVLVFDPSSNLPYGASVVATVAATATSRSDIPLGAVAKGTFTVVPKHAAVKKPATTAARATTNHIPRTGGGTVGSGSWGAVERYYLKLMNCTRTCGWADHSRNCENPSRAKAR